MLRLCSYACAYVALYSMSQASLHSFVLPFVCYAYAYAASVNQALKEQLALSCKRVHVVLKT